MNGVHDFGGMHGYGEINPEQNEPVFHDEWEKRVLGLFVPIMAVSYTHLPLPTILLV